MDAYFPVTEGAVVGIKNSTVISTITEESDVNSVINQHCIEDKNKENRSLQDNKHTSQDKVAKTNEHAAAVQDFEEYIMEICPSPKKLPSLSSENNRQKQHSEILTSLSIKKMLETKQQKKEEKAERAEQIRMKKDLQKKIKKEKEEERLKKRDLKIKIKAEKMKEVRLKKELRAKQKAERELRIREKRQIKEEKKVEKQEKSMKK